MIVGAAKVYVRTRRVKGGWKARVEVDGKSRTLSGTYQSAIAARQAGLWACHRAIVWRLVMLAIVGLWNGFVARGQRLRAVFEWRLTIDRYTIKLYRARSNRTRYNNCSIEQLTLR